MTFAEYLYRFKAYKLRRVDEEYDIHLAAWLHQQAGATKKQGKDTVSAYKSFKDFFDYEKRLADVDALKPKELNSQHKRMARLAARANT